jgi:hypothetical protein
MLTITGLSLCSASMVRQRQWQRLACHVPSLQMQVSQLDRLQP